MAAATLPSSHHVRALVGVPRMARSTTGKAKAFFRANPSGAFDQYLQDIQKLPLIKHPDESAQAPDDTVGDVRTARRMTAAELSLDAPVDRTDKDAATLGERFAGQEGGEIEDRTDGKLMREFIDRIFQKYLTPRERKILYLYYGLEEGSEAMTLEKIGALMGVTRERIRQIRERAFEKLRESPDGKALKGFWRAA